MEEKLAVSVKSFCISLGNGYPYAFGALDALVNDFFQGKGGKIHTQEDNVFPEVNRGSSLDCFQEHLVRVITYRV